SRGSVPMAASMSANRAISSWLDLPILLYFYNSRNIAPKSSLRTGLLLNPEYVDVRNRNQAFVHHLFQNRRQPLDIFVAVDDLNDDGEVVADQVGPVNLGRIAVAFQAAKNGCAGDLQLAAFFDDGFIERLALIPVALGEVEPQEFSGLVGEHSQSPLEGS